MNNRLLLFDLMRFTAIFIILFHHLPNYCFNFYNLNHFGIDINLSPVNQLNRYLGIGTFIFISGYLLNAKKITFTNLKSAGSFLYKKLIRILPLYYVALIAFCYIYNITDPLQIIIYILGLQSVLKLEHFPLLPTLWFIGAILIYYCIFIILKIQILNKLSKLLVIFIFPVITVLSAIYLPIIDTRAFLYYWIFLFGIYCAESNILQAISLKKISFVSTFSLVIIYVICLFIEQQYGLQKIGIIKSFIPINFLMLSAVLFLYSICGIIGRKFQSSKPVEIIAYSSYAMFLFHRPIWFVIRKVIREIIGINNQYIMLTILILIGMPIITIFSYFIQNLYDKYLIKYLNNIHIVS